MSFDVDKNKLSDFFNLGVRRINQLIKEEVITQKPNGKFDLFTAAEEFFKNKYGKNVDDRLKDERTLHESLKREKTELQLKVMKGELHRSEDVEAVMTDMITRSKTKILSIPSKVAPQLIQQSDVPRIQAIIQKHIEESLMELSEYNAELFINEQVIQSDDD